MNWLDPERNLLTVILVAAIGAVVAAGLINFVLLGRVELESIEAERPAPPEVEMVADTGLGPGELTQFTAITNRPVFFEDRNLPIIEPEGEGETEQMVAEAPAEVEIPELDAKVAGIIITPEMKLAMVADQTSKETLVLREGMAMAGDKSAWKIAEIRPRSVRFETETGETADLELEVETSGLTAGRDPNRRTAQADQAQQQPADAQPQGEEDAEAAARARAEEIRRRVAERRAQLRAEAERRAREKNNGDGR